MSLRRGVIANYASQFYVTAIGIAVVPLYLRYLGAEAYGLVGVFSLLQAWFQLLDMGLSPTLAREVARFRGGGLAPMELRAALRALEVLFISIAVLGALSLVLGSGWIAAHWLQTRQLPVDAVTTCVSLMGLTVPLRWMSGLYRGAVNGFERQVWLAAFNTLIATLRFPGAIGAMVVFGSTPLAFFAYQLAIALLEVAVLALATYRLLPAVTGSPAIPFSWSSLRGLAHFSGAVAVTGMIWVLVTQFDRLLLSRYLSLTEFGYFTLSVTVANGVMLLSAPMAQALMPRLARLHSQGDTRRLLSQFRQATRIVAALVAGSSIFLAIVPEQILWAWTGDPVAARAAAPVLSLYALGNACVSIAAFAYYLQFGLGTLRMHLFGNLGLVVLMLPCVWWAARYRGAVAVGYVWLAAMSAYLLVWVGITHRKLVPGLHMQWLIRDVAPPFLAAALTAPVLLRIQPNPTTRAATGTALIAMLAALVAISCLAAWLANRQATRSEPLAP